MIYATRAILAAASLVLLGSGVASPTELVARRTLPAGTIVAAGDIAPRASATADHATADQAAAIDAMVGLETRRAIFAGHPVLPGDLGAPRLVDRNQIVEMRFETEVLGIRTEGRALEPGGLGDRIRVMNLGSRTAVTAVVAGQGRVEILQ